MRDERKFESEVELRRIRILILENVVERPNGLAAFIQYNYGMRRICVYKELRRLVEEGVLDVEGKTSRRTYRVRDPSRIKTMLNTLRPRVANEERLLANWREVRLKAIESRKGVPRGVRKERA